MRIYLLYYIIAIFISNFCCQFVIAQNDKERFLITGGGIGHFSIKDAGVSQVLYNGYSVHAHAGLQKVSQKAINDLQFMFTTGNLSPAKPSEFSSQIQMVSLCFSYEHLRPIHIIDVEKFQLHAGIGLLNYSSLRIFNRYSNSAYNFDNTASLGLSARITKEFALWKREFEASFGFTLPISVLTIRPSFSYPAPDGFIEHQDNYLKAVMRSIEHRSWGSYAGLKTEMQLNYRIANGNKIQLVYNWYYHAIQSINLVQMALHSISFRTMLSF